MNLFHLYTRISQQLRYTKNDILWSLRQGKDLFAPKYGQRIMVYHGVDERGSTRFNTRFISQTQFEKQIQYMKTHFHLVSLSDYYKGHFAKDRLNISLTFDDGYQNHLTRVLPILERYNVPATFFVTGIRTLGADMLWTDWLDIASPQLPDIVAFKGSFFQKNRKGKYVSQAKQLSLAQCFGTSLYPEIATFIQQYPIDFAAISTDYYQALTDKEIQAMAKNPLITIGSHTISHLNMAEICAENSYKELKESKLYIENLIQKPVDSFAFPFGAYNQKAIDIAEEVGYKQLLLLDYEGKSPTLQARFGVNPFISFNNQMECLRENRY